MTRAVEGIDRGSLHVSPPRLPTDRGVAAFRRCPRGETCASAALLAPRSTAFRAAVARCVEQEPIPLITGAQGPRNDEIAQEHHARSRGDAGSVVVGQARETTPVFRTATRGPPDTGRTDPGSVRTTALVNPFDGDGRDDDLGAFLITSRAAFPDHAQLGINGPEDRKRPRAKEGSAVAARDHGIPTPADPRRRPPLGDGPSAATIESLPRQWRQRLPHPFTAPDRAAGDRDDLSILPAECAPTPVRDRPRRGRAWRAAARRANRDSGGPDPVPPRCDRRLTRRTPGRCRTRARTAGVTPSRPLDDTHSRLQQEHQEGRAPRTATTRHDTRDFGIGNRPSHRPAGRRIGGPAHRRLRDVPRVSQDCARGEDAFRPVKGPVEVAGQRARGWRVADRAAPARWSALLVFQRWPRGFSAGDPREPWPPWGEGGRRPDLRAEDGPPAPAAPARLDRANPWDGSRSGDPRGGSNRTIFAPVRRTGSCAPGLPRSFRRKPGTTRNDAEPSIRARRRLPFTSAVIPLSYEVCAYGSPRQWAIIGFPRHGPRLSSTPRGINS